jgi:hypothetical protein
MSADIDFPLIYCNGDSYSDQRYHSSLKNNVYPNFVAKECNGFVINSAIRGSCNRRIIRTTLHDMIQQRSLNPTQKIIALIGLSFELRAEVWADHITASNPEESNFVTHIFTKQLNWRENLLNDQSIESPNRFKFEKKFFDEYSRGRAYFFSPYAERINLLTDLIMLKSTLDFLKIDFLIFQSPKAEKLEKDYLLDFFKAQISSDTRFFDFENFAFCDWCLEQKFVPLDFLDRPNIGHYGSEAHKAFAEQVLIPKLKELSII